MPSIGGFLDDVADKVKTGTKATLHAAGAAIHTVAPAAKHGILHTPGWGLRGAAEGLKAAEKGAHAAHLDDAGNAAKDKALVPAAKWMNRTRTKYISRPIVTVALEDSANPKDWFSKSRWQSHWDESKGISPGQIYTADIGSVLPDAVLPGNLSRLNDPDFDIKNPQHRKVFDHGAAMLASGTTDAAASWFLDPLVLAGKATVIAKTAAVTKPITKTTNIKRAAESTRVQKVIDRYQAMPPDTRRAELMKDPAFKANTALADLIAASPDAETTRRIITSGMDGTAANARKLAAKSKESAIALENVRDVRIPALETELAPPVTRFRMNPTHPLYNGSPEHLRDTQMAKLKAEKVDMIAAERDHRINELMEASAGSVQNVPKVTTGQKLASAKVFPGGEHGAVTWWTYQPSKYNAPMRVLKSASTRRPGNAVIDEPGHAAEVAKRFVGRAGHGLGKGLGKETQDKLVSNVVHAANGKNRDVVEALQHTEAVAIHHIGQTLGLNPEAVNEIIRVTNIRRQTAIETIRGGEKGAFSGAKDEQGKWLSKATNDDGQLVHVHMTNTDLDNSLPMVDLDRLTKIMRRQAADLRGEEGAKFAKTLRQLNGDHGAVSKLADWEVAKLESFNRFWKPAMLLRLGYAPRVIADESMRGMAVMGAMHHLTTAASSVVQGVKAGDKAQTIKGIGGGKARKLAAAQAGELGPQLAAQGVAHKSLVDKLGALTAKEAAAGDKVAKAQEALSKPLSTPLREKWSQHLSDARAEQAFTGMERLALTGKRDKLTDTVDQMNNDYMGLIEAAKKPKNKPVGTPERPRKFSGEYRFRAGHGVVKMPDAFAGEFGDVFMDMSSSESTSRALAGVSQRYLNKLRITAGEPTTITPLPPTQLGKTAHDLHLETYNRAWERAANDQIGKDPAMRLLAKGKTTDEVLDWMKRAPAGREYVRKADSIRQHNLEDWVGRLKMHLDHYLPTPELKDLALKGTARAEDLRAANVAKGATDASLPVVHGQSLDIDIGEHANRDLWAGLVDKAFKRISTTPTNALSRHPYFAGVYRREMRTQYKRLALKKGEHASDEMVSTMQRRARQRALADVKTTLYDVANESNLAHATRFVMPFYAAWQDALQTWGKLWMEDPSRISRTMQIWNAPNKTPNAYSDSYGKKYFTLPLPKWAKNNLPVQLGMPSDTLRDLVFTGEYWYLPGFGAPVTVPAAALVRHRPDVARALEPVLPYGAGDNVLDQVLPSGWKKSISLYSKEDDEDYAKTLLKMFADVDSENRSQNRGWSEKEMFDESTRRANALLTLKTATAFGLPFAPNVKSPGQLYVDSWREDSEKYAKDPHAFPVVGDDGQPVLDKDGSVQYLSAQEKFTKDYGDDYFAYTLSTTQSNVGGIPITNAGFKGFEQYKDLIRQFPDMGGFIVGDDPDGTYNPAVAEWMLKQRIGGGDKRHLREIRSPLEALKAGQVSQGWAEFNRLMTSITASMEDRGLTSLQQKDAADLKQKKDLLVGQLEQKYPHWADDYHTIEIGKADSRVSDMETIVSDPRLKGRAGFATTAEYFAFRRTMVAELGARKAAGGSDNLQTVKNQDLKHTFDFMVQKFIRSDTAFEDIYYRWLSRDDLRTGGGDVPPAGAVPPVTAPAAGTPTPAPNRSAAWATRPPAPTAPVAPAAPAVPGQAPAAPTTAAQPAAVKPTPAKPTTPAAPAAVVATKGNIGKAPVSHNVDGTVSKLQTTTFVENGQTVVIPYAGPDGKRLSKAEAVAQYKRTGKFLEKH